MFKLIIEKIPFDLESLRDPLKFNSSNHGDQKNDYKQKLTETRVSLWVKQFHKEYETLTLDESDVKFLEKCITTYALTGKISNIFADDIEDMIKKYEPNINWDNRGFFVRAEDVSLKYGMHGNIPHKNMQTILESIITCPKSHAPIGDPTITLYFFPWHEIHTDLEFRVFVKDNQITAISQQHCYRKNNTLNKENIHQYVNLIIEYFKSTIVRKISHISSYCMDICILEGQPYFIEINPFGKEYSSGSALFHWLNDEDKLYGKNGTQIHFRYL